MKLAKMIAPLALPRRASPRPRATLRSRGVVTLVLAQASWAASAAAQNATEREAARLLMDRGDEQVDRGDLSAALTLYQGAHEIMHVPTTGVEVARTLARLGKLVEARDAALQVSNMPMAAAEPKPFQHARAAADELARELSGQIPWLSIEVSPPEVMPISTLRIDGGVANAVSGSPYPLNPGEHSLVLSAPRYGDTSVSVALARGERRSLRLQLEPLPAARPQPLAQVPKGRAVPQSPSAGDGTGVAWPVWLGVGLSGAGILVGTVAGIVALDRASDARVFCEGNRCPPEAQPDLDAALLAAGVSNVGWALAGVGAALSLTSLWLTSRSRQAKASPSVAVSVTPHGAALICEGAL
jgi:hypothetical protein